MLMAYRRLSPVVIEKPAYLATWNVLTTQWANGLPVISIIGMS